MTQAHRPAQAADRHLSRIKRIKRFAPPRVAVVVAALLASACAMQPSAQTVAAPRATADPAVASRQAVTRLLALSCTQTSDCATVGVGARSCGGPEEFVAYAVHGTPEPALRKALQHHAALRKKQLDERGEMSTCEVLPDPGAQCSPAGQCQLLPRRQGHSGSLIR